VAPTCKRQFLRPRALSPSLSLPGGTGLSASILSRARPFSQAARWVHSVSVDRPFARPLSLAGGPHLSATSPSLTYRSRSPSWMRPQRAFPRHSLTLLTPFLEPAPTHSLSCTLSRPTLHLSRTARAPVELRRGPSSVLWPPSSLCRVCCLDELRLLASNARHPLVCPQPLCFARSTLTGLFTVQPKLRHHRLKASLRPRCCSSAPESPLEVSNSPTPLISHVLSCCPRNRSLE
jgi:hypothetical protein